MIRLISSHYQGEAYREICMSLQLHYRAVHNASLHIQDAAALRSEYLNLHPFLAVVIRGEISQSTNTGHIAH
jgi:hypothetical protein